MVKQKLKFMKLLVSSTFALIAMLSHSSNAQSTAAIGISVPPTIEGMNVKRSANPRLQEFAESNTYQNGPDRIVINVFQANFPNVGIWHEAHKTEALKLFGPLRLTRFGETSEIMVQSAKSNGIVEVFGIDAPFSSTAIATIGFGRWMVTIHSTSKSLSPGDQMDRVSRIAQSIKSADLGFRIYSTRVPSPCTAEESLGFEVDGMPPLQQRPPMAGLVESIQLAIARADASGETQGGGLSMKPDQFCKASSSSGRTTWFQTKRSLGMPKWVQLVGATGMAVEGFAVPDDNKDSSSTLVGGIIVHGYRSSTVATLHGGLPNPISGQLEGLLVLAKDMKPN